METVCCSCSFSFCQYWLLDAIYDIIGSLLMIVYSIIIIFGQN
jgi:hypothetical protein